MDTKPKVVVTGMGIVAPNGIGLDAYWDSLVHCRSGIGPITLFDTTGIPLKIAGEVKGFDLRAYTGGTFKPHRLARQTQFALAACRLAVEHARLTRDDLTRDPPLCLVMGICSGAVDVTGKAMETVITRGPGRILPHTVAACQPHAMSAAVVQMLGVQTSVTTLSAACPSGLDAVTTAARMIKEGRADLAIVGAADSTVNISTIASFCAAGLSALSTRLPPDEVSRPFDRQRSGAVPAEGAGFLVLERMDSARARGASLHIEIAGGATCTDTPGSETMEGLFHAMNGAMRNAAVRPDQMDYICANAVSDPMGDRAESNWIKACMGPHAYTLPISSIRGVTGHPLAPAGLFQIIACALSFKFNTLIPTANLREPDPDCDLDYVPLTPRYHPLHTVMANGHGMGGENSSIVLKRIV